jgi:hypothetical protein
VTIAFLSTSCAILASPSSATTYFLVADTIAVTSLTTEGALKKMEHWRTVLRDVWRKTARPSLCSRAAARTSSTWSACDCCCGIIASLWRGDGGLGTFNLQQNDRIWQPCGRTMVVATDSWGTGHGMGGEGSNPKL